MNELERDVPALLARYADEERPPPAVDASIRALLREEATRPRRRLRGLAVYALAAAAAVLLWWLLGPAAISRTAVRGDSAAVHVVGSPDRQHPVPRGATPPFTARPLADDADDADDDPGVTALGVARELIRAGAYEEARTRLEPCPRTVGTDDLLEECEYLVLQALCSAGERQEGRRRIAVFREQWPRSIHQPRLKELCK